MAKGKTKVPRTGTVRYDYTRTTQKVTKRGKKVTGKLKGNARYYDGKNYKTRVGHGKNTVWETNRNYDGLTGKQKLKAIKSDNRTAKVMANQLPNTILASGSAVGQATAGMQVSTVYKANELVNGGSKTPTTGTNQVNEETNSKEESQGTGRGERN